MSGARSRGLALVAALASVCLSRGALAQAVPDFGLPHRDNGQSVHLSDFSGQIVLLDFFAYWCAQCRAASKALEADVQEFFAARDGNPQGIPVRVVSINIEKTHPESTDQFIASTGMSLVLDDFSGSVLKHFGAVGIPYLVFIDGSRSRSDSPAFRVVYTHCGPLSTQVSYTHCLIDSL